MHKTTRIAACAAALLMAATVLAGATTDAREAKVAKGPVKIFLLSGQSNMTGRGALGDLNKPAADQKATLVRYIMEPQNVEKYKFLYNGKEKTKSGWTIRDDVFITIGNWPHAKPGEQGYSTSQKHGGLAPYYGGFRNGGFGPELGIGNVLGDHYDEPVLLVKIAFGATSLVKNFGPPSAAGGTAGALYTEVVKCLHDAITNLPEVIPGYDERRGYEIVGFFWNQGEHDMAEPMASAYEETLACLIKDLRKEFKAPAMKVVVATTGFEGWKGKPSNDPVARKVIEAQLAISKRPEFKGTVATAETRDFYRSQEKFGGNNQGIHWHANGESYWLIGEAMGREMVKLLGAKQ